MAPIGGDLTVEDYRFVPPALGGERSRRPGLQARIGYASDEPTASRLVDFGVSGHYGWERRPSELADSWAGAFDFALRRDWIGVAGEAFSGENIDAFGGALGLDARAAGGWAELQFKPTTRFSIQAGAGVDEVRGAAQPIVAATPQSDRLRQCDLRPHAGNRDVIRVSLADHDSARSRRAQQQSFRLGLRLQVLTYAHPRPSL